MEQPVLSTEVTAMSQRVQSPEDREEQASDPHCHEQFWGQHVPSQGHPGGERSMPSMTWKAGMWHLCRVLGANRV